MNYKNFSLICMYFLLICPGYVVAMNMDRRIVAYHRTQQALRPQHNPSHTPLGSLAHFQQAQLLGPRQVLDVAQNASIEDVKKAYRKLSKHYHPDQNQGNQDAGAITTIINQAYEDINNKRENNACQAANPLPSWATNNTLPILFATVYGAGFAYGANVQDIPSTLKHGTYFDSTLHIGGSLFAIYQGIQLGRNLATLSQQYYAAHRKKSRILALLTLPISCYLALNKLAKKITANCTMPTQIAGIAVGSNGGIYAGSLLARYINGME